MSGRADLIAAFLRDNGLAAAQKQDLAADFSPRRYARLTRSDGRTVIFMDADAGQKTREFLAVAALLRQLKISAPEIHAADAANGLVLMQDFGNRNVGRLADAGGDIKKYILRAADILVHLHKTCDITDVRKAELPIFDIALLARQAGLFLEGYLPYRLGRAASPQETQDFGAIWTAALKPVAALPSSLMLRDYMLDNLMELPGAGLQAIGVLDFQDAGLGSIAYDLASLCERVRRDLDDAMLANAVDYYTGQIGEPAMAQELLTACRLLAAQRHMRILGVVTLHRDAGKLAYLPRVKACLRGLMRHAALAPVKEWLASCRIDIC